MLCFAKFKNAHDAQPLCVHVHTNSCTLIAGVFIAWNEVDQYYDFHGLAGFLASENKHLKYSTVTLKID